MDIAPPVSVEAELLTTLVEIVSVNPLQAGERSGPGGEEELAQWVAERARGLGADVCLDEAEPGRPNVYAYFSGSGDRTVVVDVHLDTVGVEHMTDDPFDGRHENGRVYGRGAVDTKATLAVIFPLLDRMRAGELGLEPNLMLVGTVAEEAGGLAGAYRFRDWAIEHKRRFNEIVVAEPTLCAPVYGHKGGVGLEMTVKGEAAHSSKPHLGQNAIIGAARIIEAFRLEHERIISLAPPTPVGTGTLSVTEISGGRARNIIPDECVLYAGRRVAPGEDPEAIYHDLCQLAIEAAKPLPVDVVLPSGRFSPGFYQEPDSELVATLAAFAGVAPDTATYGSNALVYREIADQIVVFGPGSIDQAHKEVEWIEISELARASTIFEQWLTAPRSGSNPSPALAGEADEPGV
ncbi:MAG: M20 family metallopeptidase [Actinomycetia bacterium]|nr:M20 family metallopeptidase [Actinomycetes bacterium]MCP4223746.1 M20 family metallopeptidase [Actinomycetes bacterium]MCP5032018.1 M20 family metallopeptidase [Actinomycetes bacterium]